MKDLIPGGLAKGKTLIDIYKKHFKDKSLKKLYILKLQLKKGIKVELEHTTSMPVAKEIAMDHLYEDPKYYDKLKKIEKKEIDESYYNPRTTNYIYHNTNIDSMVLICKSNLILKYSDNNGFVSFTRDKHLDWGNVCITINKDKLSNKYKIIPYDDSIINMDMGKRTESEERIKGNVDIKNSIVSVYINMTYIKDDKKLKYVLETLKQNNIPFSCKNVKYRIDRKEELDNEYFSYIDEEKHIRKEIGKGFEKTAYTTSDPDYLVKKNHLTDKQRIEWHSLDRLEDDMEKYNLVKKYNPNIVVDTRFFKNGLVQRQEILDTKKFYNDVENIVEDISLYISSIHSVTDFIVWVFSGNFKYIPIPIKEKYKNIINKLENIYKTMIKLEIYFDLNIDNMGYDKKGNLKLHDL